MKAMRLQYDSNARVTLCVRSCVKLLCAFRIYNAQFTRVTNEMRGNEAKLILAQVC